MCKLPVVQEKWEKKRERGVIGRESECSSLSVILIALLVCIGCAKYMLMSVLLLSNQGDETGAQCGQ